MSIDPDELPAGPLTEVEPAIRSMVLRAQSQPGKHAARNALRHIETAWKVRSIDPEGAAVHTIIAEEEAASAIFHALQHRKYEDAERLKPYKSHIHKAAVVPFLQAAGDFLSTAVERMGYKFLIRWKHDDPKAKLELVLSPLDPAAQSLLPIPPLNFKIDSNGVPYDFAADLQKVADVHSRTNIQKHIRYRADLRHRMLYSTASGIPTLQGNIEGPISTARDRVLACLAVFLFIDQYPTVQLLPQQGLTAFLAILPKLDPSLFDPED